MDKEDQDNYKEIYCVDKQLRVRLFHAETIAELEVEINKWRLPYFFSDIKMFFPEDGSFLAVVFYHFITPKIAKDLHEEGITDTVGLQKMIEILLALKKTLGDDRSISLGFSALEFLFRDVYKNKGLSGGKHE
jgi:hypothetical protein